MAAKLMEKVKGFMGFDSFEDDDFEDDFLEEEEETVSMLNNRKNKVLSLHTTTQMKVVLYEPKNFEEAPGIVNDLKNRKPVIVNLENIDKELGRKFVDFLSGAIYALEGTIQKISAGIFVIAPNNVDITGNIKEELKNKGAFWQK